jgi:hypothetical protein
VFALEALVEAVLICLQARFGTPSPEIAALLPEVKNEEELLSLGVIAVSCETLEAFEVELRKALP